MNKADIVTELGRLEETLAKAEFELRKEGKKEQRGNQLELLGFIIVFLALLVSSSNFIGLLTGAIIVIVGAFRDYSAGKAIERIERDIIQHRKMRMTLLVQCLHGAEGVLEIEAG